MVGNTKRQPCSVEWARDSAGIRVSALGGVSVLFCLLRAARGRHSWCVRNESAMLPIGHHRGAFQQWTTAVGGGGGRNNRKNTTLVTATHVLRTVFHDKKKERSEHFHRERKGKGARSFLIGQFVCGEISCGRKTHGRFFGETRQIQIRRD